MVSVPRQTRKISEGNQSKESRGTGENESKVYSSWKQEAIIKNLEFLSDEEHC